MQRLFILLMICAFAIHSPSQTNRAMQRRGAYGRAQTIIINGKVIDPRSLIRQNGKLFIDVDAVAQALNTPSKRSSNRVGVTDTSLLGLPDSANHDSETVPTDMFRRMALHISDDIEHLRSEITLLSYQRGQSTLPVSIWTESGAIDTEISKLEAITFSGADVTLYYALAHANLAFITSQSRRLRSDLKEPLPIADELDSLACSTEARIALVKGKLTGKEQCSVMLHARQLWPNPKHSFLGDSRSQQSLLGLPQ